MPTTQPATTKPKEASPPSNPLQQKEASESSFRAMEEEEWTGIRRDPTADKPDLKTSKPMLVQVSLPFC